MPTLTIGILSWGATRTLTNTLESYKTFGLDRLADQKVIFFQQVNPRKDVPIAKKYGYEHIGSHDNLGIALAYKRLVEHSTGDFFLFLENDWVLLEKPEEEISQGVHLLEAGIADVVRYRHRKFPGHPLWTLQFKGDEYSSPRHLLDAVHWTETPENFKEIDKGMFDFYFTTARNANWTNNPTMFRTEDLKNIFLPHMGKRDVEVDIQEWWEQQEFIVAQKNGLFTHRRIG